MKKLTAKNYQIATKKLFNSEEGKLFLAFLKVEKVDRSAFGKTVEETYANLAVKEFVQGLLLDVNNPMDIDEIIINDTI